MAKTTSTPQLTLLAARPTTAKSAGAQEVRLCGLEVMFTLRRRVYTTYGVGQEERNKKRGIERLRHIQ